MEQVIIFSMMLMSFLLFTFACVLYAWGDFKAVLKEKKMFCKTKGKVV